jgi:hypothetical protein
MKKKKKTFLGRDEIGGVRKMWDSLRGHTEAVGLAHLKVIFPERNSLR